MRDFKSIFPILSYTSTTSSHVFNPEIYPSTDLSRNCVFSRAVKVNALIYELIVAEINAIKYFKAVNATLFTSDMH